MTTARGKTIFDRLANQDFPMLMSKVRERGLRADKLINTEGLLNEVDITRLDEVLKDINKNDTLKKEVLVDAGALSLRFQEDPKFAIDIYKTITDDVNKINKFKNRIQDTEFRNQYAIMMTVKMGTKGYGNIFKRNRYEGYNKNPMTLMLQDVFEVQNGNFRASTDYYFLDDDEQKMMVDKKIRSILNMPISQEAKQKTIDNFFGNIDVPGFTNQEDYFKNLII